MSCASPAKLREESIAKPMVAGDFESAVAAIEKNKKDLYNSADDFLYEFDLGLLEHYGQNWKKSIAHLERAQVILEDLYSRSVTNEAAAILTNDNVRPYRSYPFEEEWLYQTQILNYLALGEVDEAVVESRRALLAVQALKERDGDKFVESGALQYLIGLAYEWQKSPDDARIAYNDAIDNFGGSLGNVPKQAAEIPQGSPPNQEIVVVGYAGVSPTLAANEFWGTYAQDGALVLHYKDASGKSQTMALAAVNIAGSDFSGRTMTVQFAIPRMIDRTSQTAGFAVSLDNGETDGAVGDNLQTEIFSSTKTSLKKDLENGQTAMLIRTAARVILRTIAANKAKDKMETGNGWVNLLLNIGTDIATGALEQADLRIGSCMPASLQILRIPVEAGKHSVKIDALDYSRRKIETFSTETVNVKKGEKVFVFAPLLR
ncbi:hypothetical protein AGMMS49938_05480 [Fibrobacterales bacterium]|nr:hypothetical protein AGMMS49938_05480 [Fibrobacterales bacterium]